MGALRVFLALAVLVHHTGFDAGPLVPADLAVQLFFVISGYYMGLVLTIRYTPANGPWWWRDFYLSRFLRLYPTFVVVSLGAIVFYGSLSVYTRKFEAGPLAMISRLPGPVAAVAVMSNATMVGQDVLAQLERSADGRVWVNLWPAVHPTETEWLGTALLITPAWSIGLEVWFYLLAPWLARRKTSLIVGLLGLSLAVKWVLILSAGSDAYFFFPAQLCYFLAGVLAYRWAGDRAGRTRPTTGLVLLAAVLVGVATARLWAGPAIQPWVPFGLACLIPRLFATTADWRWDRFVGELSYPIYLTHALVIAAVQVATRRLDLGFAAFWLTAGVTVGVSLALHLLVERPVDRFRRRFTTGRGSHGVPEPTPRTRPG